MAESKRRRIEYSSDPNKWLQWYEELEDADREVENQLDCDDSDSGEEDHVTESDHDTASEQDGDDTEDEDVNMVFEENTFYLGKDGSTKWRKWRPPVNIRTRSCNIVTHLPGPKGEACNKKSEIEIFDLLLDENIVNIIVTCTNIYIEKVRENFSRERDARNTDITEIRAFVGLLYLIGSMRCSRKNLHKLWDNSRGNGLESCYLCVSEKRFRFLLRCIRFDNIHDRNDRKAVDKLAPIREIHELVTTNFQKYFTPGEYLTVDEQLLAFRGHCPFRQYIPSKPAKYGLKVFALCDAKTAYTLTLEPYVGKQPDGPYCVSNSAEDIVVRLTEPVQGTNRNITGDNWFSSLSLLKTLKMKKLTYVGTLRKNRREVPKELLPNKIRTENSSMFGFQEDCTIVSYCPKKNKVVLVLSSMHFDDAIDETTGASNKPEMVTFYNMTKVGVDLLDQLCQHNDVSRNTRRWPMVLFYNILNITAINAFCIYKYHKGALNENASRSEFLENLSWHLIKPQIQRRSELQSLPRELRRRAKLLVGDQESDTEKPEPSGLRGRCHACGRARNKTTRHWCLNCKNWACGDHLRSICSDCYEH